uniref:Janus kinase n=1 Tax=Artemia franciscana TaxID=6661 RepID=C6ZH45_ARTSF|nr:Janus kinase [Artemia franciscana]
MNTNPHVVYSAKMATTVNYLRIVLLDRTQWHRIPDDEKIATVECIVKECCKHVGILPSKRYLFGIFNRGINYWLPENMLRTSLSTIELLELRIRFHPSNLAEIFKDDIIFLTYYFCQIRKDFIAGRIKELCGCVDGRVDKSKKEIAHGLGIADMYREMLQCNKTISDVEKEHKSFFPKELLKSMHYNLYKNVIRQPLKDLESNPPGDSEFIMYKYVEKVRAEAMKEFHEPYECQYSHGGKLIAATICVENSATQSWRLVLRCPALNEVEICDVRDICFICVGQSMVEISRKNGVPVTFIIPDPDYIKCFVSVVSGYYRLSEKFMFNLSTAFYLPSIVDLLKNRVHPPIGGNFEYSKLDDKRDNAPGSYLIRESHKIYDQYFIDYVDQGSFQPKTIVVSKSGDIYKKEDDSKEYQSLQEVALALGLLIRNLLPPSENDRPPLLLLCCSDKTLLEPKKKRDNKPVCIPESELHVFRGKEWEMRGRFTVVRRGFWKSGKEETSIAIKNLQSDITDSKPFMQSLRLSLHWRSDSIATFYGIVLPASLVPSLVMEYFPLGTLDVFLQKEKDSIAPVDLVEASSYLANAVYYLGEIGAVHGKIRSWNLFVYKYSQDSLKVKLSDPIVPMEVENEIAWIPIEYHTHPLSSLNSLTTDIWAFGTTLWEIFSFGCRPFKDVALKEITKSFMYGKKPQKPALCPVEIYRIILSCWDLDPSKRLAPQTLMRDMNQIFYGIFNARKRHDYAYLDEELSKYGREGFLESELCSISSLTKEEDNSLQLGIKETKLPISQIGFWNTVTSGFILDSGTIGSISEYSISSDVNDIYVLGKDQLQIGTRIGRGHFGEVCLGALRRRNGETLTVAVKRLIPMQNMTDSNAFDDMMREFEIMKTLKHPKIVEIIGIIESPEFLLVMEYVPFDSLLKYLRLEGEKITNDQLLRYAADIAEGMEYLAEKKIVHRDLAARNILVVNETSVKISDFGLAQKVGETGFYAFKTLRDLPLAWYAPESIGHYKFSSQSDVWSYGVTMFEMFSRGDEPQLAENDQLLKVLESGRRLPCPPSCPQVVYREIMWPCWNFDPIQRPTFTNILERVYQVSHQV